MIRRWFSYINWAVQSSVNIGSRHRHGTAMAPREPWGNTRIQVVRGVGGYQISGFPPIRVAADPDSLGASHSGRWGEGEPVSGDTSDSPLRPHIKK